MSVSKISKYESKIEDENNKEISYDEFQRDILLEKIKSKDQQIYDLLSKIKSQDSKMEILNKEIEGKDLNIYTLEQNYKCQIEEIKKMLGFKGDIELLINKKETSYEYEFITAMKSTFKDNNIKDEKINKLKEEIKNLEKENEQLNIFIEIKKNNETIIKILKSIEKNKSIKKADIKIKNDEESTVKNLIKKNKYLIKSIDEIKNNINKGTTIINSLPYTFKLYSNNSKNNDKKINIEIKNEEMEKNLENLKDKEKKETQILLNKYLSIVEQNKKDIIKGNEYINNIDNIYIEEIKKYKKELFQLFKLIQNFINIYNKTFNKKCSLFLRKEDCDKLLEKEFNNLNILNYPLLFKFKKRQKNNDKYTSSNEKKGKNEIKIKPEFINMKNNKEEDNKKMDLLNTLNEKDIDYNMEDFLNKKNSLFSLIDRKKEDQLKNLSKEELVSYVKNLNSSINYFEDFINKYINSKNKNIFDKILEIPKNDEKKIKEKLLLIDNRIKELIYKQNQTNIVIEVSNNVIKKIKNENLKINKRIKISSSNDMKTKIPKITTNSNGFNINNFIKPLSNRNSIKNNLNIKSGTYRVLTDREYIKDKSKIYKIKIK